jgi:hypothetical protein
LAGRPMEEMFLFAFVRAFVLWPTIPLYRRRLAPVYLLLRFRLGLVIGSEACLTNEAPSDLCSCLLTFWSA